jgi:hypothetical protein
MDSEVIVAIIGAVFASSGLWGLLQYLISRKDKTGEKIDKLTVLVQEISERVDHSSATSARTRIMRFDDELINGIHHSREYFQQTLEEIDTYETYCQKHPEFKNNACVLAIEHIRRVYSHLQDSRGFIQ